MCYDILRGEEMARPSKTVATLKAEGKSHRTKAELAAREKGENSVLSGSPLFERTEVKNDKTAHKEFLRVLKLMKSIGKNDALYSSAMNTYCKLYAEICKLEADLTGIDRRIESTEKAFEKIEGLTFEQVTSFNRQIDKLISKKIAIGTTIDRKRNMRLAIEKENVMTISSALRAIPKNPQKEKVNPILAALQGDDEGDG